MTNRELNLPGLGIAESLINDYFCVYYIDLNDDSFILYTAQDSYLKLVRETEGDNFFSLIKHVAEENIHPDDLEHFLTGFTKENILHTLIGETMFTMNCRIIIEGVPVYVHLKTAYVNKDRNHLVLGITDVNEHMLAKEAYKQAHNASLTYARIVQALAEDYFSIYVVDPVDDSFTEYSSTSEYNKLGIEKKGNDFFSLSRKNIVNVIYAEDCDRFLEAFTKENILMYLKQRHIFTLKYRLIMSGEPKYVSLKATLAENQAGSHIIIGISNIDAQMKLEEEYAKRLADAHKKATKDPLTGIRNNLAFSEMEKDINQQIAAGTVTPFAVAVCDLNGLKQVNDTLGHKAGDDYIKNASKIICSLFNNSPVFRIGGDEFAVIVTGIDYVKLDEIESTLRKKSEKAFKTGDVSIACGASRYCEGMDMRFSDIFERADTEMYEEKRRLKQKNGHAR